MSQKNSKELYITEKNHEDLMNLSGLQEALEKDFHSARNLSLKVKRVSHVLRLSQLSHDIMNMSDTEIEKNL